jgi:hypothetical protein
MTKQEWLISSFGSFCNDTREVTILRSPNWGGSSGSTGAGIDLTGTNEYVPTHLIRKIKVDGAGNLAFTLFDGSFHVVALAAKESMDNILIASINKASHLTPTTATGVHIFF